MNIYTTHTLATKLGTTPKRIRMYVRDRQLTGFKMCGEWRFTEEDLARFIEQQRRASYPEETPS